MHRLIVVSRVNIRGLVEPWGSWQLEQPSTSNAACGNSNGPETSTWQSVQTAPLPCKLNWAVGSF